MPIWGGLRVIRSRLFLDIATILCLTYCANTSTNKLNSILLCTSPIVTYLSAGLTGRWTMTFPMLPFMFIQIIRRGICPIHVGFEFFYQAKFIMKFMSNACVVMAGLLSVLFPAVELKPVKNAKYNVGVVDIFLPVDFETEKKQGDQEQSNGNSPSSILKDNEQDEFEQSNTFSSSSGFVTARIFYPTNDKLNSSIPYLNPEYAALSCSSYMKCAAPPPLRKLGWILHNWRLIHIPAIRNAPPLDNNDNDILTLNNATGNSSETTQPGKNCNGSSSKEGMPIAVYSHGLFGNATTYSYHGLSLAANGTVVLMLDHRDGSAPVMRKEDGSFVFSNASINGDVRSIRTRTEYRVKELLASTQSLINMNTHNIPQLESLGVSFLNKLNTKDITFMGHSFGGATALTAASRQPDLVSAVVAHEPAIDWMPDDARRMLFCSDRLKDSVHCYDGGTGGYEQDCKNSNSANVSNNGLEDTTMVDLTVSCDGGHSGGGDGGTSSSLHGIDMLFLYSQEWANQGWGGIQLLKCMHKRGKLGRQDGFSDVGIISQAHHSEFSDVCSLLPIWLARAVGLTGKRNPLDTLEEIWERSFQFMNDVRRDC